MPGGRDGVLTLQAVVPACPTRQAGTSTEPPSCLFPPEAGPSRVLLKRFSVDKAGVPTLFLVALLPHPLRAAIPPRRRRLTWCRLSPGPGSLSHRQGQRVGWGQGVTRTARGMCHEEEGAGSGPSWAGGHVKD